MRRRIMLLVGATTATVVVALTAIGPAVAVAARFYP
jgi:hypothetical protein